MSSFLSVGAMVLGKLPVPGRPTILITVGQGPIALAVGAGGGGLDIFTLIYPFSSFSLSFSETARYRLKYCLKEPLNPKQPSYASNLFRLQMKACRIQRIQVKLDNHLALEKYNFTTTVLSSHIVSETDTDLK